MHLRLADEVADPRGLINEGDVLLHTSRTESFSMVMGEALQMGASVVSTPTAGGRYWAGQFPDRVHLA